MNETVMRRTWEWRTFVWAGVVGSVLAWTWVWFAGRGASVVMLLVAFAAVALAMRATAGMRLALVGLMVAGLVMFLASLYWLTLVLFAGNGVNAVDVLTTAVFPMVAAILVLMGSVAGYRHAKMEATKTTTA